MMRNTVTNSRDTMGAADEGCLGSGRAVPS